jgi:hypothetical protein
MPRRKLFDFFPAAAGRFDTAKTRKPRLPRSVVKGTNPESMVKVKLAQRRV